jgi:hypothetical protein
VIGSHVFAWVRLACDLPTCASIVGGMAGVYHQAHLLFLRWGFTDFAQAGPNCSPPQLCLLRTCLLITEL